MKHTLTRHLLSALLILAFLLLPAAPTTHADEAAAPVSDTETTSEDTLVSDTEYAAAVIDEEDLLTDKEEAALLECMAQLTPYGNVLFYSTNQPDVESASDLSEQKYREFYEGSSGLTICINMGNGRIGITTFDDVKVKTDAALNDIIGAFNSTYSDQGFYRGLEAAYNHAANLVTEGAAGDFYYEFPEPETTPEDSSVSDTTDDSVSDTNGEDPEEDIVPAPPESTDEDTTSGSVSDTDEADDAESEEAEVIPHEDEVFYENEETGYAVMILDPEGLLSGQEELDLALTMLDNTEYGNMVFSTVTLEDGADFEKHAQDQYYELFGNEPGALFQIDMGNRGLTLSCSTEMEEVLKKERDSIVDNSYEYASDGDYYSCATEVFTEINIVYNDGKIAHTMRNTNNAILAVILSLILNFMIIFLTTRKRDTRQTILANAANDLTLGAMTVSRGATWKHKIESSSSGSSYHSSFHSSSHSSSSSSSSSHSSGGFKGGSSSHKF